MDVVYVATPHSAHHDAACLPAAGKAVLVEKPFTLDLRRHRSWWTAARQAGVFLMEAMWMRCHAGGTRLVELIGPARSGGHRRVRPTSAWPAPFPPKHRMRAPDWAAARCSTSASTR